MPKKTTILIVILLLFTVGLVYIAIRTENQSPPDITEAPASEEDIIPTINPQTDISFSPSSIDTSTATTAAHIVDVMVDTNGQNISGVELQLSYDPTVLANVSIAPTENNLFGENPGVLVNSVEPDLGRITFIIALGSLDAEEVSGAGTIATLRFNTLYSALNSTEITVLPKTTVRTLQSTNSLLRAAQPLTIMLPTASSPAPITTTEPPLTSPATPLPAL